MIIVIAALFRFFLKPRLVEAARAQADRGLAGSMEDHAAMDMSISDTGSLTKRLISPKGLTSVSHIFVMEWVAVLRDIVIGLLIAGAVGAWVPDSSWQSFFLVDHPLPPKMSPDPRGSWVPAMTTRARRWPGLPPAPGRRTRSC